MQTQNTTMCAPSSNSSITPDLPSKTARLLPADYKPDRCTVVVAKGHLAAQALGNSALRQLVLSHGKAYSTANKRIKTKIVCDILEQVKESNPDGVGFVKFHQGRWFESSDNGARDIITARFRDSLSHQYKSSTRCKVIKRRNEKAKARRRAMRAKGLRRQSDASVVSVEEGAVNDYQHMPELEPLPLDTPEAVVSSSYTKLEEMFQSRERSPVVPLMTASSSSFINEVATPAMVPSSTAGSAQRPRSSRSIAGAVRSILQVENDVIPLETALDELYEFEFEDIIQNWAADTLV